MSKPTLLVLAAGMGSRYGKLKQMDAFGPNGETIIDYSIHDAVKAGFGKVVFIIREYFKEEFQSAFDKKWSHKIECVYVTQELDKVPEGSEYRADREKPWGTAHAVWVAKDVINGPFAVINADDYYGTTSFKVLTDFFTREAANEDYAVVAYYLKNTLSDHGTVNRGICFQDEAGHLTKVIECTKIARQEDGNITYPEGEVSLVDDTLVSMNMWAFKSSYFEHTGKAFKQFLAEQGQELKSEFYIPAIVDELINADQLNVKVLDTDSDWFGVTYMDDKPIVQQKLQQLLDDGVYPADIFA